MVRRRQCDGRRVSGEGGEGDLCRNGGLHSFGGKWRRGFLGFGWKIGERTEGNGGKRVRDKGFSSLGTILEKKHHFWVKKLTILDGRLTEGL